MSPRIYIADLEAYNQGSLVGRWVDLEDITSEDCLTEAIEDILEDGHEEWAVHDHEDVGNLGEYPGVDRIVELAELYAQLGDEYEAYLGYADHVGGSPDVDTFRDAYVGHYDSELAYSEEYFDACLLSEVPQNVRMYIDYESFSRDQFINDCFSVDTSGGVYVFSNI